MPRTPSTYNDQDGGANAMGVCERPSMATPGSRRRSAPLRAAPRPATAQVGSAALHVVVSESRRGTRGRGTWDPMGASMSMSMCAHPCYASVYDSVHKPVFRVRCDELPPVPDTSALQCGCCVLQSYFCGKTLHSVNDGIIRSLERRNMGPPANQPDCIPPLESTGSGIVGSTASSPSRLGLRALDRSA
eukprot:scaffold64111_cov69-Phaeocystis_antarctica.AAC.8